MSRGMDNNPAPDLGEKDKRLLKFFFHRAQTIRAVILTSWINSDVANEEQLESRIQSVRLTTQPKTPILYKPTLLLCPVSEVSR